MAYADRDVGGSRVVAIVIVAVILAVTGYAFVTGLAYQYIKKQAEKMDVFDIEEPPPPPEEVPPPPPDTPVPPPPTTVVVQKPLVQVPSPPVNIPTTTVIPPSQPPAPPAPPAPPPPPPAPPKIAKKLTPRGSPQSWVTDDDYPPAALRSGDAGTTGFRLDVGPDGRVTACSVTSSSGSSLLDQTACRLLQRRARFNPAEDENGNKIAAVFASRFTWKIPQ
ncbi:energy transducer TonB [Sphingomonas sp. MG17]|jgi:protein TonB|uniref:Energy transducer TonB n=1 Tax=Sphingomonas tagetis TaxID=2949092 RepID=A0A9X2KMX8_9SPHN|nr:TonB family protein [Sphingomonas tagetis]MCP3732265.1 energy transducer TonB [Sphingomonas tagetis]